MAERVNSRELIVNMLVSIEKGEARSHIILKEVCDKYDYIERDKALLRRTVMGVLERKITLDFYIDHFSSVPVSKMKPFIKNLLRMSLYQILYMDRIPDAAICNEAVKLCHKKGFSNLSGFVNGLLRSMVRSINQLELPRPNGSQEENLEIVYSCPKLVVNELLNNFSMEDCVSILDISLRKRNLYVRISENTSREKIEEIKDQWHKNGIGYEKSPYYDYAYMLSSGDKISGQELFRQGYYTVQDFSSMMVGILADAAFSDNVLDLCGAPGGKTLHIADKMMKDRKDNKITGFMGEIICRDISPAKIDIIRENVNRHKLNFVKIQVWDATVPDETLIEKQDLVILDVPCSGLGVMGKKPDIKYNLTKEGLESLQELQTKIIDNAVKYVKPGGELIYSTCTLRKEENRQKVEYILSNYAFEAVDIEDRVPKQLQDRIVGKGMLELLPKDNCDGFFICKLRKSL